MTDRIWPQSKRCTIYWGQDEGGLISSFSHYYTSTLCIQDFSVFSSRNVSKHQRIDAMPIIMVMKQGKINPRQKHSPDSRRNKDISQVISCLMISTPLFTGRRRPLTFHLFHFPSQPLNAIPVPCSPIHKLHQMAPSIPGAMPGASVMLTLLLFGAVLGLPPLSRLTPPASEDGALCECLLLLLGLATMT